MKVTILGWGIRGVGLATESGLAGVGHQVQCTDVNRERVNNLKLDTFLI